MFVGYSKKNEERKKLAHNIIGISSDINLGMALFVSFTQRLFVCRRARDRDAKLTKDLLSLLDYVNIVSLHQWDQAAMEKLTQELVVFSRGFYP